VIARAADWLPPAICQADSVITWSSWWCRGLLARRTPLVLLTSRFPGFQTLSRHPNLPFKTLTFPHTPPGSGVCSVSLIRQPSFVTQPLETTMPAAPNITFGQVTSLAGPKVAAGVLQQPSFVTQALETTMPAAPNITFGQVTSLAGPKVAAGVDIGLSATAGGSSSGQETGLKNNPTTSIPRPFSRFSDINFSQGTELSALTELAALDEMTPSGMAARVGLGETMCGGSTKGGNANPDKQGPGFGTPPFTSAALSKMPAAPTFSFDQVTDMTGPGGVASFRRGATPFSTSSENSYASRDNQLAKPFRRSNTTSVPIEQNSPGVESGLIPNLAGRGLAPSVGQDASASSSSSQDNGPGHNNLRPASVPRFIKLEASDHEEAEITNVAGPGGLAGSELATVDGQRVVPTPSHQVSASTRSPNDGNRVSQHQIPTAPELSYVRVGEQTGNDKNPRLRLFGLPWEHTSRFLVTAIVKGQTKFLALSNMGQPIEPTLEDLVIDRSPENMLLLVEAYNKLRDRKEELARIWDYQTTRSACPFPYENETKVSLLKEFRQERPAYKPLDNYLRVRVPQPQCSNARTAFTFGFTVETRRLVFSRGLPECDKYRTIYIDVLSGQIVGKTDSDVVFPETEDTYRKLISLLKGCTRQQLDGMKIASFEYWSKHREQHNGRSRHLDNLIQSATMRKAKKENPPDDNGEGSSRSKYRSWRIVSTGGTTKYYLPAGYGTGRLPPVEPGHSAAGGDPPAEHSAGVKDKGKKRAALEPNPYQTRAVKTLRITMPIPPKTDDKKRQAMTPPARHPRAAKSIKTEDKQAPGQTSMPLPRQTSMPLPRNLSMAAVTGPLDWVNPVGPLNHLLQLPRSGNAATGHRGRRASRPISVRHGGDDQSERVFGDPVYAATPYPTQPLNYD
jgi:hypothetical protein